MGTLAIITQIQENSKTARQRISIEGNKWHNLHSGHKFHNINKSTSTWTRTALSASHAQTRAKITICYGSWSDRYNKKGHPHTTRKNVRCSGQSHTEKKVKMICYKERLSDNCNKGRHRHTTGESCEAIGSHTMAKELICYEKRWSDRYNTRRH